jgi:5'-3' exonuclease
MKFTNFDEKVDKIIKGCQRAFEKLLAEEKLRDGELVFADDEGKPVIVRAREFEAYQQKRAAEKEKKKS